MSFDSDQEPTGDGCPLLHLFLFRSSFVGSGIQTAKPPLVTCIMPTCDRHRFLCRRPVRYFLRQDYLKPGASHRR